MVAELNPIHRSLQTSTKEETSNQTALLGKSRQKAPCLMTVPKAAIGTMLQDAESNRVLHIGCHHKAPTASLTRLTLSL